MQGRRADDAAGKRVLSRSCRIGDSYYHSNRLVRCAALLELSPSPICMAADIQNTAGSLAYIYALKTNKIYN